MTSEDGTHSRFQIIVSKFTLQTPQNQKTILFLVSLKKSYKLLPVFYDIL
jgi:hypothetical protein